MKLWRRKRRHDCFPPGGVVFTSSWTCPECRARWRLIEHANATEWVRDEATA